MTFPSFLRAGLIFFMAGMAILFGIKEAFAQKDLPPPPSLEAAYLRERTELLAEKRALQEQLTTLKKRNEAEEVRMRGEVDTMTLALANARHDADELESQVLAMEEEKLVRYDRSDVIESTLEIASLGLRKLDHEVSVEGESEKVLARVYSAGIDAIQKYGTVHVRDGAFFDLSGMEHKGTIVHVGRIGALGFSNGFGGTLMLAPGDGLVVVDPRAADVARRIAAGEVVNGTPVHLFDPLAGPHEHRPPRTWVDVANAGGAIAWIIMVLGLIVLIIVMERVITLARTGSHAARLMKVVEDQVLSSQSPAAVLASLAKEKGALSRVVRSVMANPEATREQHEDQAAEAIYREMPKLERMLPFLGVIAGVAPMLGLLGTVTGMISTFEVITEHGTGDPKLLSGGISEALITTEFGLIVAIPALLLHNMLARWSDRTIDGLQTHALSLINLLEKQNRRP